MAYGGAGQDILFAGTVGDRLIDWTGNHNSFYAPFSPFGMPTISRTLQPALQDYLYALSKSDGADPFLGLRYGGDPARNGEPFGELGLVLQHDDAWHEQNGPPFNPMPENLGGVGTDIKKTANILPLGSPASAYSAASNLPAGPPPPPGLFVPTFVNTVNLTSVSILVVGTPGTTLTYTVSEGAVPCDRCRRHRIDRDLRREPRPVGVPRRDDHGHRPRDLRRNDDDAQWDDDQEHRDPADAHGDAHPRSRTSRTPRPSTSSSPARSGAPRTSRSPTARTASPTAKT